MSGKECQALVVEAPNGKPSLVRKSIPIPVPASNQALVKISHIAQNPTDSKYMTPILESDA